MYVIRGDKAFYPFYAGRHKGTLTTVYSWSSTKENARKYSIAQAIIVAGELKRLGQTNTVAIERVG